MYTPLNIKTHNALLCSIIKIEDLIKVAVTYKFSNLTITDTNMYGVMDFYLECTKKGIKPIVGMELTFQDMQIIVYVMSLKGYGNLIHLATINSDAMLTIEDLIKYSSDLILILPYASITLYSVLKDLFVYLFIGYRNQCERVSLITDFESLSGSLIYMNPVLCLKKDDQVYLKYLEAIKKGITYDEVKYEVNDNYLMTEAEMVEKYPNDLENNYKIGELCNLTLNFNQDLLPAYECENGMDAISYLKQLCKEGLKRIFKDVVGSLYITRLKYELSIIDQMGFCNYFLIVWDYVKYAKEHGILVGPGRGSAAGSLVAYCLNITTVDPLKYNLLFERFLNPERITMPDIDIDFEDTRRDEVIDYCINKYGAKKVAQIITFGTFGSKQALRDVAKTVLISPDLCDSLCNLVDSKITLINNYHRSKKIQNILADHEELKKVYRIAMNFEGIKRYTSKHAAGIVMSKYDLDDIIPLDKSVAGSYVTAYSMEHLEKIGLLKMDFLVLRNLTLISNIQKDVDIDIENIPINDRLALLIFTNVRTVGIFQFESPGMMNFLRKFRPMTFSDIYDAIALFRPGPISNIDSYIKRRHNEEKIDYIHPDLRTILEPTSGIIIYQEQIMEIAKVMAGYSLGEADVLRRAMSKKVVSVLNDERTKFINKSIERGYNESIATKVYNLILKFAQYGFNKAHSVVYALISYRMAYLKAHYPLYFIKNILAMTTCSNPKVKEYINEAKLFNVSIKKPNINFSTMEFQVIDDSILYPLTSIKTISINLSEKIINERKNGQFIDIYDFMRRCYDASFSVKIFQTLALSGMFDGFQYNHKTLFMNADKLLDYGLLACDLGEYTLIPELTIYDEYTDQELMQHEVDLFGLYLSYHIVTKYRIKAQTIALDLIKCNFNAHVKVIGYVERMVVPKGVNPVCFIKISDETANVDLFLKPDVYKMYTDIKRGDVILVNGLVEKRYDKYQININALEKLS